ncbi:amidase family protein, partial [Bordetella pertussis]
PMRLGATPTALMGLVPPLLRRWMRAHPDIQIYIEPGTSSVLLERVMAGQLDAAILVHPNFELHKTCAWSLIREERLVLLAPSALRVGNALRVAAREPFIQYDRKVVAGKMADEYLRAHGVRPKVQFELDGIEHISALVAEGFGDEVKRRILIGTYVLSHGYYDAYYLQAQRLRRLIAQDFQRAFAGQCDVIMGPVSPTVAKNIGDNRDDPTADWLADVYTLGVSLAGLPAMSVPCGFGGQDGRRPVGLQIIGNYFDEGRLLALADRYQQVTDWHQRAPVSQDA